MLPKPRIHESRRAWPGRCRQHWLAALTGLVSLVMWQTVAGTQTPESIVPEIPAAQLAETMTARSSQDPSIEQNAADADAWEAFRQGKAVIVMRHALAPGTGDPADFDVTDCSTQRNLSEEGRRQAERIGERIRKQGITDAIVLSSQWCRCLETARLLGLGEVEEMPALNSFFQNRSRASGQTRTLSEALDQWLVEDDYEEQDVLRILVTHQVNITALTRHWPRSGEMLIVTVEEGSPALLAAIETD